MNIDNEFLSIIDHIPNDTDKISGRDLRILKSLAKSIVSSCYITENQSRLLIKIFKENIGFIKTINSDIETLIDVPIWSRPFRITDTTKRLYLGVLDNEPYLHIECAFSNFLRKQLSIIGEEIEGFKQSTVSTRINYSATLTEKNIVTLVEKLLPLRFNIDETIRDYYKIISAWTRKEICNQYLLTTITDSTFKEKLLEDLGIDTPLTTDIIADRSIRYQYFAEKKENPQTLIELIAHRQSKHIWIPKQHKLSSVLESLVELKRLPVLFVFDMSNCYNQLITVHNALKECNIDSGIGIYFRVNNNTQNGEFNKLISDYRYNAHLDKNINIVGIPNGKVPKFFLKDQWQPMSVISLDNSLKNNKTSVFLNCCDLIISYSNSEPLISARAPWA